MSLLGQIYPFLVEEMRLKPGVIWTTQCNVHTLAELKQVLSVEIKVADSQLSNQTNQTSNQTLTYRTYQTNQICKPNIDQPNQPNLQPNIDQPNQPNFPSKH